MAAPTDLSPHGAGMGVPTVAFPPTSHPDGNSGPLDVAERVGQPRGGWDGARWLWGTIVLLWHTVGSFCAVRGGGPGLVVTGVAPVAGC